MVWNEPLALGHLFINIIAGSSTIFAFLAITAVSVACARFRMLDKIFYMMLIIFSLFFAPYIGGFYLLMIVLAGFIIYESLGGFFR